MGPRRIVEAVVRTRGPVAAITPRTPVLCVLNGLPPRGPRPQQAHAFLANLGVPFVAPSLGLGPRRRA